MKVCITIPCRNEEKYIGKCLDSVVESDYPKELLEVLVVDGMSDDGTRDIIKSYSEKYSFINLMNNNAKVTPYALNLGIKNSIADIYIILGAHTEIFPDFIQQSINAFSIDKNIGCVGGILEQVNEDNVSEIIAAAMSSSFGVGNAYFRTGTKEGYVDTVAFGAYKKDVFEKVGYFDEDLVRNQDDEFNFRVSQGGFKIFLTHKIRSRYFVRGSFQKLYRQYFQYGYWKVFVNQKHSVVTSLRQLIPPIFVSFLILGMILSVFISYFNAIYSIGLTIYLVGALLFSLKAVANKNVKFYDVMFAFFVLHFSYGLGYLKGLCDFVLLKKKPQRKYETLSR